MADRAHIRCDVVRNVMGALRARAQKRCQMFRQANQQSANLASIWHDLAKALRRVGTISADTNCGPKRIDAMPAAHTCACARRAFKHLYFIVTCRGKVEHMIRSLHTTASRSKVWCTRLQHKLPQCDWDRPHQRERHADISLKEC